MLSERFAAPLFGRLDDLMARSCIQDLVSLTIMRPAAEVLSSEGYREQRSFNGSRSPCQIRYVLWQSKVGATGHLAKAREHSTYYGFSITLDGLERTVACGTLNLTVAREKRTPASRQVIPR